MPSLQVIEDLKLLVICLVYGLLNLFELLNQVANIMYLLPYLQRLLYVIIISLCAAGHFLKLLSCIQLALLVAFNKNWFICWKITNLTFLSFWTGLAAMVAYNLNLVRMLLTAPDGKKGNVERATLWVIMILVVLEFVAYIPVRKKLNEYAEQHDQEEKKFAYLVLSGRPLCISSGI